MFSTKFLLVLVVISAMYCAPQAVMAEVIYIDFGDTLTTLGTAPDDPNNQWNNVTTAIGTNSSGQLLNLLNSENTATAIDFLMVARFNGVNTNGTTSSTILPADATRDSLYGNVEAFNSLSNITPVFKLSQLDPNSIYSFTFFASRMMSTDNRETLYTIEGNSTTSVALNAANNVNTTVTAAGLVPDAFGEIKITITEGPNNTNTNSFAYLNALRVDITPVPEPGTWALLISATAGILGWRLRRRAA
jgi:hypothetical protein